MSFKRFYSPEMKRFFTIIFIMAGFTLVIYGQEPQSGYKVKDSVIYRPGTSMDSSLIGKSVFNILALKSGEGEAEVKIYQSQYIINAMNNHLHSNKSRVLPGFRVRIFFDNKQNARSESEAAMNRFISRGLGAAVYRNFQNPFFKVTVGDFRTKSEAVEMLNRIKSDFPAAFVVKENINYPIVDKEYAYSIDTVKVIKRL